MKRVLLFSGRTQIILETDRGSINQDNNYDFNLFPQVVTTTTRSLRRPTGALYNPNRVRHRSTTTTTTTTTTIQTPAASAEFHQQRLQPGARLVRRRKYGSSSNRTRDSDTTASDAQPSDSSNIASTDKGSLFNPLNPELNPICYLLALLAHHFLHVSRIRVKSLTIRLLMSYVYGASILDVSRSHTTTQHSR